MKPLKRIEIKSVVEGDDIVLLGYISPAYIFGTLPDQLTGVKCDTLMLTARFINGAEHPMCEPPLNHTVQVGSTLDNFSDNQ